MLPAALLILLSDSISKCPQLSTVSRHEAHSARSNKQASQLIALEPTNVMSDHLETSVLKMIQLEQLLYGSFR